MKLVIGGESFLEWLDRATYDGAIGLFYNDTWGGILAYLIVGLLCLFAVIGIITVLGWLFGGKKKGKDKDPYKEWIKTGKY